MDEAKVHIHEFEAVDKQVQEVLKQLRPILPIKFEVKEISVRIPAKYAPKSYQILRSFGKVIKEDWTASGDLKVHIEMPGGLEEDFYSKLSGLCHGDIETEVISTK